MVRHTDECRPRYQYQFFFLYNFVGNQAYGPPDNKRLGTVAYERLQHERYQVRVADTLRILKRPF